MSDPGRKLVLLERQSHDRPHTVGPGHCGRLSGPSVMNAGTLRGLHFRSTSTTTRPTCPMGRQEAGIQLLLLDPKTKIRAFSWAGRCRTARSSRLNSFPVQASSGLQPLIRRHAVRYWRVNAPAIRRQPQFDVTSTRPKPTWIHGDLPISSARCRTKPECKCQLQQREPTLLGLAPTRPSGNGVTWQPA